jgi:hypothetical protein
LPRFHQQQERLADARKLAVILLASGEALPEEAKRAAPMGSDPARLRGLPAIGPNVSGAVRGSDPVRALLSKESRRRP